MIKRLTLAALIAAAPLAAAQAQTVEECLKATFEVAKVAQTKNPTEEQIRTMEAQLQAIEALCDEKKFTEADEARRQLETMIATM